MLQCCKLVREEKVSAEEWLGQLGTKVHVCEYKERDSRIKDQFINRIMMTETTGEL